MQWILNDKPVSDEELSGWNSFVYIITNLKTGKKYIGKKRFTFVRHKRIKNKRYRRKIVSKSDWEDYWGSSKSLALDIEKYGKENFKREIIRLCSRLSDLFYNEYAGGRISRTQLGISSSP
jgi:hypothetical protein